MKNECLNLINNEYIEVESYISLEEAKNNLNIGNFKTKVDIFIEQELEKVYKGFEAKEQALINKYQKVVNDNAKLSKDIMDKQRLEIDELKGRLNDN